jgi:hypothetical protein
MQTLGLVIAGGCLAFGCARSSSGTLTQDPPPTFDPAKPGPKPPEPSSSELPLATPGQKGCGCTADYHALADCNGQGLARCAGTEGCDPEAFTCKNACDGTKKNKQSVGCEYYATQMEVFYGSGTRAPLCFAAIVANTWHAPAHLLVDRGGQPLDVGRFAGIPTGSGPTLKYEPYSTRDGLAPGQAAVLFLAGDPKSAAPCPLPPAYDHAVGIYGGGGKSDSFHVTSDVPVVAYQISPYGGGKAAVTGASLLLPTSAWGDNHIGVSAIGMRTQLSANPNNPSMNIIAMEADTKVTFVPVVDVAPSAGLPGGKANTVLEFTLGKGQYAQFSQGLELTGSVFKSNKPVGLMAGSACANVPADKGFCDHMEQMIPPISAWGNEYVAVAPEARGIESYLWRIFGAVDGTTLTWSKNVGGPATTGRGQVHEVWTREPFVVRSQDKQHPILVAGYMPGSVATGIEGAGDPDFVLSVAPDQYLSSYVFVADPTYPRNHLVVIRSASGPRDRDVELDCAGKLGNWHSVGGYEWTRVDLTSGNFEPVGKCSSGRHEIRSRSPFGLGIWGWGTIASGTRDVSYGYPGGMNVRPIQSVVVPAVPR